MACTVEMFRSRFPEFADDTMYPDSRIQVFLDDANGDMGGEESRWCGKYDRAQCYLAAHYLSIATKTDASGGQSASSVGVVTSKSAGGVSVSRSSVAKDLSTGDDYLISTAYGQQYLYLRNSCMSSVLTVTC